MRNLDISIGNGRRSKVWTECTLSFDDLVARLSEPVRTAESVSEYAAMGRDEKEKAKDHGGFMGGRLRNGRRRKEDVESRSMLTFDADKATEDFISSFTAVFPYRAVLYTTHSHTPERPRCRVVVPLLRDVTPDEHNAIARLLADGLGMKLFDKCSFESNQLMYWPSCPNDGEYLCLERESGWLDPDDFLSSHPGWEDCSRLPMAEGERREMEGGRRRQENPLEKDGIVGAWCRAHSITDVLDGMLCDVYEPTDDPTRYHLRSSDSIAGLMVYDDVFAYSHHATDPAYGRLLNSFDLVRVHLFGEDGTFSEMAEYASRDERTCSQMLDDRMESAMAEFAAADEEDGAVDEGEWRKRLKHNRKSGEVENSLANLRLILQNDPMLKGIVFNQLADGMEKKGVVPWRNEVRFWRDADDAQLVCYIDEAYGTFSQRNYDVAVAKVADDRSYHPIREMFASLPEWDGVKRVDTLLVDYLGAEDNELVRAMTRKTLCAAYRRVMEPGVKFDTMLVLNGPQGIGKSTLIARLGGEWYSDSLNLSDMNDKTAAEKLQGYWILEIGELAGMKKADIDKVKAFISRQDDKYRAAFGRRVTPHPRQCVFFGTTNSENGYLRDITGNRRFWDVCVTGKGRMKPWDMDGDTVSQIWAEVMVIADSGETLHLDERLEKEASKVQRRAMEKDEREGLVRDYLEIPLPDGWDGMELSERRLYLDDPDAPAAAEGRHRRMTVSNMEIWCECLGRRREDMKPSDSYAMAAIMYSIEGWERSGRSERSPLYGKQRVYVRKA